MHHKYIYLFLPFCLLSDLKIKSPPEQNNHLEFVVLYAQVIGSEIKMYCYNFLIWNHCKYFSCLCIQRVIVKQLSNYYVKLFKFIVIQLNLNCLIINRISWYYSKCKCKWKVHSKKKLTNSSIWSFYFIKTQIFIKHWSMILNQTQMHQINSVNART